MGAEDSRTGGFAEAASPEDDYNGFWKAAALMKPDYDRAVNQARTDEWRRVLGLVCDWVQSDANLSGAQLLSLAEALGTYTSFLLGRAAPTSSEASKESAPASPPVCAEWCGNEDRDVQATKAWHAPADRNDYCTKACADAGRSLNPAPTPACATCGRGVYVSPIDTRSVKASETQKNQEPQKGG